MKKKKPFRLKLKTNFYKFLVQLGKIACLTLNSFFSLASHTESRIFLSSEIIFIDLEISLYSGPSRAFLYERRGPGSWCNKDFACIDGYAVSTLFLVYFCKN